MDAEVRIGCLSMKCAFLMDAEVRIGCSSMKRAFLMDTEVRDQVLGQIMAFFG